MLRSSRTAGLSLAQLEKLMRERRAEITRLCRIRDRLQKKLDDVQAKLREVSGGTIAGVTGAMRARNQSSLQEMIHRVLAQSQSPLSVGDIMDRVSEAGYRSTSGNFRGIVNQTLIKDKRFAKAGRGLYQIKK
jgi:hypothetical protein